jgi:hypothetical protein
VTKDEFDALPDVTQRMGQREEIREGKRVVMPVLMGEPALLWQPSDTGPVLVTDCNGVDWFVGELRDGTMAKREARSL